MKIFVSIVFWTCLSFSTTGQDSFFSAEFSKPDSVSQTCQRLSSTNKTLTGLKDTVRLPVTDFRIIELPFKNRFEIKTFNDNWSGGFTEIHDDFRSYGLDLSYVFPAKGIKNIKVSTRFSGLTYRTGNTNIRQRTDELYLKFEKPIYFFKKGMEIFESISLAMSLVN